MRKKITTEVMVWLTSMSLMAAPIINNEIISNIVLFYYWYLIAPIFISLLCLITFLYYSRNSVYDPLPEFVSSFEPRSPLIRRLDLIRLWVVILVLAVYGWFWTGFLMLFIVFCSFWNESIIKDWKNSK